MRRIRHTKSTCQIRDYVSSYIVRWLTLTLTHFGNAEMSVAQVTYTLDLPLYFQTPVIT